MDISAKIQNVKKKNQFFFCYLAKQVFSNDFNHLMYTKTIVLIKKPIFHLQFSFILSVFLSFNWFPILFLFSDNSHIDHSKSDQKYQTPQDK
jgi:hypothetical protein